MNARASISGELPVRVCSFSSKSGFSMFGKVTGELLLLGIGSILKRLNVEVINETIQQCKILSNNGYCLYRNKEGARLRRPQQTENSMVLGCSQHPTKFDLV